MLVISLLGIIEFVIFNSQNLRLFKGHLFYSAVKVMVFLSDVQYYVPLKLCRPAGSTHLFKITKRLTPKYVKITHNIL